MTLDSASAAAATATPPDEQDWPAGAGPEGEALGALAELLADPSAVSSEEQEAADHSAASMGAAASTPVADNPLAAATPVDEEPETRAAAPPERPDGTAEEDVIPAVIILPPPTDRPAADEGEDDDHEAARVPDRPAVILLPDRSGETDAGSRRRFDDALIQDIAAAPSVSSDQDSVPADMAWLAERGALLRKAVDVLSESSMGATALSSDAAVASAPDDGSTEGSDEESAVDAAAPLSSPDAPEDTSSADIAGVAFAPSSEDGPSTGAPEPSEGDGAPEVEADVHEALLRDVADAPAVTSEQVVLPAAAGAPPPDDPRLAPVDDAPPAPAAEHAFEETAPDDIEDAAVAPEEPPEASDVASAQAGAVFDDLPLGAVPPGPVAALAFATDADTELALRDGLAGYESTAPGCGDPQVWQGGLRAAIAALSDGHSARLIFVDVDGIPFPAGAIHELAAVCEVGTIVVAIGSDGTARPGRDLMLAGVADYLAKPLTAETVRAAAARATPDAADRRSCGCVAGFIGSGGSGATTLMTATALHAAARGCYVSVLDLNRSVASSALALGVEPAAGLDQLLEAAGQARPESDVVDGVRARRSDRIELYAYRWNPAPPAAPTPDAVGSLLAALKLRSHLVLVDGGDDLGLCMPAPIEVDRQVLVAEPIVGKAVHAARMIELLGSGPPMLFVQNHTRAFKRGAGGRVLRDAGLEIEPDVVIPFEPSLPETADWGWPNARLPRSLRKPLATLTDRLLEAAPGPGVPASIQAAEGS